MAQDWKSERAGRGGTGLVSISLPLADVHSLYLARYQLAEIIDTGALVEGSVLLPFIDLLDGILPPKPIMEAIYTHLRRGSYGPTLSTGVLTWAPPCACPEASLGEDGTPHSERPGHGDGRD